MIPHCDTCMTAFALHRPMLAIAARSVKQTSCMRGPCCLFCYPVKRPSCMAGPCCLCIIRTWTWRAEYMDGQP
jgi:hypothetical protein